MEVMESREYYLWFWGLPILSRKANFNAAASLASLQAAVWFSPLGIAEWWEAVDLDSEAEVCMEKNVLHYYFTLHLMNENTDRSLHWACYILEFQWQKKNKVLHVRYANSFSLWYLPARKCLERLPTHSLLMLDFGDHDPSELEI